jgi:hypothetical protein
MQLLVVRLMSSCCVHRGLRLVRRRVATQSRMCLFPLYMRAHTFKKKKKKNCTCYMRFVIVTRRNVTYGIRAGSTRDLGSLRLSLT